MAVHAEGHCPDCGERLWDTLEGLTCVNCGQVFDDTGRTGRPVTDGGANDPLVGQTVADPADHRYVVRAGDDEHTYSLGGQNCDDRTIPHEHLWAVLDEGLWTRVDDQEGNG